MKKKLLLVGVTLLLLSLLLLAGCGGEDTPSTDTTAPTGTEPTGTEPTASSPATQAPAQSEEPAATEAPAETEAATDYFEANRIETVAPDTSRVPDAAVTGDGYDIFALTQGREYGYRYGCTYLYNEDGSVDAYFACVGTISGEWDWISYRHSPDGGKTWEDEKVVLTPTQGSMDHFSCCDPGVVYFNGYYYLGYTSTLNGEGKCNNVFVARSENPDGPFEKWNGKGWGGTDPQPILYYEENFNVFGIGEPSFVELNGTLYLYYTCAAPSGEYTMVATADATDENWPATLEFHGAACKKNTDSIDVKYVEEWGKFVGLATGSRMGPESWLAIYESNDGIHLELVDVVKEGTYQYLHNAGLSSRPNGHIRITEDADKLCAIYAYGDGWGTWNTRVQPISLALSEGNDMAAERAKPNIPDPRNRLSEIPADERYIAMIRPVQDVYVAELDKKHVNIRIKTYDTYFEAAELDRRTEGVTFSDYDPAIVRFDGYKAYLEGVGETPVTVTYGDNSFTFHIRVTEEDTVGPASKLLSVEPVWESKTLYLPERSLYRIQLRLRAFFGDGSFREMHVDATGDAITYTGYDPAVLTVDELGIVTPVAVGETTVTMTFRGMTCTTTVKVTDNPEDAYYKVEVPPEINYEKLDFSVKGTETAIGTVNSANVSYDESEKALKAQVTGNDALFYLPVSRAMETLVAEDYKALEITYKCSPETSAAAVNLQVFFCVGDILNPDAQYQVLRGIQKDGEYHTITIDLTRLSYWKGDIHTLRIDFFDQSEIGDVMFIKSVNLIPAD